MRDVLTQLRSAYVDDSLPYNLSLFFVLLYKVKLFLVQSEGSLTRDVSHSYLIRRTEVLVLYFN